MDKDYLNILISDIEKANSTEEKIHLLTVSVSELSKEQLKTAELLENAVESLGKSSLANKKLLNVMSKIADRLVILEEGMTKSAQHSVELAEIGEGNVKSIKRINKHLIEIEARFRTIFKLFK